MWLITKPTRITEHSATLIDNIYCNISNLADTCKSGILRVTISDHYAIFCINKSVTIKNAKQNITKREFSNKNIAKFNKALKHTIWDAVYTQDVQSAYTEFQGVIDQLLEKYFPQLTITMTYKTRYPWMTEALRTQIKAKNLVSGLYSRYLELSW